MLKHTIFFDGDQEQRFIGIYGTDEVLPGILQFLTEHSYHPPYIRSWNQFGYGELINADVTVFDVGSHTEFFVVIPPISAKEEGSNG